MPDPAAQATLVRSRPVSPEAALAIAAGALDRGRLALLVAPLEGDVRPVLGRYQRPAAALAEPYRGSATHRRRTGGVCLQMGVGQVYVAIVTPHWTTLFDATPRTVLARYVRPVLRGLSLLGPIAHYAGRDWITVHHRAVAWVGWEIAPSGATLFETLVAVRTPFIPPPETSGYPAREEDPLRDAQPLSLWGVGAAFGVEDVADRLARGVSDQIGVPVQEGEIPPGRVEAPTDDAALTWSAPREDAIGFVEAGVRLDGARIGRVRFAGDFYADSGGIAEIERALQGLAPSAHTVGKAVDSVLAGDRHVVEGLRSPRGIVAPLLHALDRALKR